jgi:hypothetical protein
MASKFMLFRKGKPVTKFNVESGAKSANVKLIDGLKSLLFVAG